LNLGEIGLGRGMERPAVGEFHLGGPHGGGAAPGRGGGGGGGDPRLVLGRFFFKSVGLGDGAPNKKTGGLVRGACFNLGGTRGRGPPARVVWFGLSGKGAAGPGVGGAFLPWEPERVRPSRGYKKGLSPTAGLFLFTVSKASVRPGDFFVSGGRTLAA